jgi:hypothetical protein
MSYEKFYREDLAAFSGWRVTFFPGPKVPTNRAHHE